MGICLFKIIRKTMKPLWMTTGRLGNQLFEFAALFAFSKQLGVDYYFQDPKYFEEYLPDIKRLLKEGIDFMDRVSIHVRLGDYVNNDFYVSLLKTTYYEKAMALFPEEKFLVFSDNIDYCKTLPVFKDCEFSEGRNEIDDFNLQASCKHNIIANSSFSYWCGILNPNPGKKVICPIETKYYADGVVRTKYPKDFIQLDFSK